MGYLQTVLGELTNTLPAAIVFGIVAIIPFAIVERLRPAGAPPRLRDYAMNIAISSSTLALSLPLGTAAGMLSGELRALLPWQPVSFVFADIAQVKAIGGALEVLAMIFVPLLLHDAWFYWSHRLEHRIAFLWQFHQLHHSDDNMNVSTYARDHFLQTSWRAFFSIFTLGLIVDLDLKEAGRAALYSTLFLTFWSMFYHSAIRVQLPWLDRVLVTPQVHRIHHSAHVAHQNRNFADVLPLFDILFGTFHRPARDEFPQTGLGANHPPPSSWWTAQFAPVAAALRRHGTRNE
jgi:sterol desaturase/sphingolipid hydroxylase (fatty acid hydroxylase superfamily)